MANSYESEMELQLEDETAGEFGSTHETAEGEGILGAIGNVLGGLLGEEELQHEMEQHEWEQGEGLHEYESLHEGSLETGEEFFGRIARGIGSFVKRAAPILKQVARVAAPMVASAIGGPFGGILGKVATSALGEGALEDEFGLHELEQHEGAGEFGLHEYEQHEYEQQEYEQHESAQEVAHEIAHHEITQHEALGEVLAEAAAHEQHEGEAEAMAGAAVITTISPADRRALRQVLPHMVRGVAILTRILRRRRATRPALRAVPTVVRRAVQSLKTQAAAGQPITRKAAARATAAQVRRVIGNPTACAAAIAKNVRTTRAMKRPLRAREAGV